MKILVFSLLLPMILVLKLGWGEEISWGKKLNDHRQSKDLEFKNSPVSPLAGWQRLLASPGEMIQVLLKNERIVLSSETGDHLQFVLLERNGTWTWDHPDEEVHCRLGDREIPPGEKIPARARFTCGSLTIQVTPSGDRLILQVFNARKKEISDFHGLVYFYPDPEFSVPARIERLAVPEKIVLGTSIQQEKTFFRHARLHFRLQGRDLALSAFKSSLQGEESRWWFIPFTDVTTGEETYGAGRFLELEEPEGEEMILDFNYAFNPLCNYSGVYNCPIPPAENELRVAVRAGEKTYPIGH